MYRSSGAISDLISRSHGYLHGNVELGGWSDWARSIVKGGSSRSLKVLGQCPIAFKTPKTCTDSLFSFNPILSRKGLLLG